MRALATLAVAVLLLSPLAAAQQTFTVTLVPKTVAHPYFGQGHPSGYAIDGVEGAELVLDPNTTYTFQLDGVPASHPFYISTSEAGGGLDVVTDGVTGNFATGDDVLTFTTPDSAGGEAFWYQCANHSFMGYRLGVTFILPTETDAPGRTFAIDSANPGVAGVRVSLVLAETEAVRVEAFDALGRRVAVLHRGALAAGSAHTFALRALRAGAYVVRASGDDWSETLKVTVAR